MNPTRTLAPLFLLPLLAACHPAATPAPETASTPPADAAAHAQSAISWIAAAQALPSSNGNNQPSMPSRMRSLIPPRSAPITGSPKACASSTTSGPVSM